MAKAMKGRGLYRWGANWVAGEQLDKLQAKEKEIDEKIKVLEAEFADVQKRIDAIDRDIADTERSMRRMDASAYVRDPVTGRIGRTVPPRMYYGLQKDLQDLKTERAQQDAKVAELRATRRRRNRSCRCSAYTGTQRLIDAEGAADGTARGGGARGGRGSGRRRRGVVVCSRVAAGPKVRIVPPGNCEPRSRRPPALCVGSVLPDSTNEKWRRGRNRRSSARVSERRRVAPIRSRRSRSLPGCNWGPAPAAPRRGGSPP